MNNNEKPPQNMTQEPEVPDFEARPELVRPQDTNDFYTVLPGGYRREPWLPNQVETFEKDITTKSRDIILGRTEAPYGVEDVEAYNRSVLESHSAIRLDGTQQDFFNDIDNAIVGSGVSLDEVEALNQRIEELKPKMGTVPREERAAIRNELSDLLHQLREKVMPAYLILRNKGYKHSELYTVMV
ncbi:MAG: hypothetical protein HYZ62_01185 [Candidatus Andersenbacteria bacterium]|nr:hypothetical protein [Candidatus Andersenbacteria bacterium]